MTKPGSHWLLPGRAQRLHQLQRDADAGEVLVRIRAVVPLRIDDRQRRRQSCVGLVMIGDDQVDAQLARPPRGIGAADAAVDRDDERARPRRAADRSWRAGARSRPSAARG